MNRRTVTQIQPIEQDPQGVWRRMEAPINGFRLTMNLPYICRIGFKEASLVSEATVRGAGYLGAIRLNNGAVTYLYR
jgi:hypothetical protein